MDVVADFVSVGLDFLVEQQLEELLELPHLRELAESSHVEQLEEEQGLMELNCSMEEELHTNCSSPTIQSSANQLEFHLCSLARQQQGGHLFLVQL